MGQTPKHGGTEPDVGGTTGVHYAHRWSVLESDMRNAKECRRWQVMDPLRRVIAAVFARAKLEQGGAEPWSQMM